MLRGKPVTHFTGGRRLFRHQRGFALSPRRASTLCPLPWLPAYHGGSVSPPMTSPLPSPLPIDPVFQLVLEVPALTPRPDLPRRLNALFRELAMDEPPRPVEEIEDQ